MSGDATRPRRVEGLVGVVSRGPLGTGSKSERQTTWIETAEGRFELRRKGAPAFGDHSLDGMVGHQVRCDGSVLGYTLLAEHVERLD